jgi:YfiH family protein
MLKKEKNGIVWFEFEKLQPFPHFHHAIFSRKGGKSLAPYAGLNLGYKVGDNAYSVAQNRRSAFEAIETSHPLVQANQVHGKGVCRVLDGAGEPETCDALCTDMQRITLGIEHADCQAAILFDPIHNAFGCIHSGWRGNCQNIYKEAIEKMKLWYGSNPHELIVCISPSLGPEKSEFINYKTEFPEQLWAFKNTNNYFNLWELAKWQLESEGVLQENIEIAKICTYSDPELFYSFRRDRPITGRHLTVAWLDKP